MTATSPGEETTAQSQATVFFISNNVSNPNDVLQWWLLFTILVMPRYGRGRGALELWKGAEVSLMNGITAAGSRPTQAASSALDLRCSDRLPPSTCQYTNPLGLGIKKTRHRSTWIDPKSGRKTTRSRFLAKPF